jgi:hypothetical protein
VEMHGDPHRYMQQQMDQQALYDQRYLRKDDAVRWSALANCGPSLTVI